MAMRARFAFPVPGPGREDAAAPGSALRAEEPLPTAPVHVRPRASRASRAPRARARAGPGGSALPVARVAVGVLEEVDPQAHAQRQVARVRKHREDAVGRRGEPVEHADEPP